MTVSVGAAPGWGACVRWTCGIALEANSACLAAGPKARSYHLAEGNECGEQQQHRVSWPSTTSRYDLVILVCSYV